MVSMKTEERVYYLLDMPRDSTKNTSKDLRYNTPEDPLALEVTKAVDSYLQKKKAYESATNCTVEIDRPAQPQSSSFASFNIKNRFTKFINRLKSAVPNIYFSSESNSGDTSKNGVTSYQQNKPVDVTAILATIRNAYENEFSSHTNALQQFVAQFIRLDNFCDVVNCAWNCSCDNLKQSCVNFLKVHWMEVTCSAEFYNLSADRMKIVMLAAQKEREKNAN